MATPSDVVRRQLAVVSTTFVADLDAVASQVPIERRVNTMIEAVPLLVPTYYDAAGLLAVAWYDEIRDESRPAVSYAPTVIGDPETDWIDREAKAFRRSLDAAGFEREAQVMLAEVARLAEKEVARGFRDSILGNTRIDTDSIGWSRVARPGACKFCVMLAGKGSVYRSESTAIFAAHRSCHCAARPEFRGGTHGEEADVIQYLASSRRARSEIEQAARNKKVRKCLNANYPDAPG